MNDKVLKVKEVTRKVNGNEEYRENEETQKLFASNHSTNQLYLSERKEEV